MTGNSQINNFIEYMTNEKKSSKNTLAGYECDLERFNEYVNSIEKNFSELSVSDLDDYKNYLNNKGFSASSVSRAMSSIRGFYKYLLINGEIEEDPSRMVKNVKIEKKGIEILTSREIENLLLQPDMKTVKGIRDRAMLEIMYATGVKVSELVSLQMNDVNTKLGFIICRANEFIKHERTIYLYPAAVKAIRDYLELSRCFLDTGEDTAFFLNTNGLGMTRQGFWKILKSYSRSAQINKTITPRTLRHSFAMHLLENGADIKDIKEILGHLDIASTRVYANYITGKIKDSYIKFHPRA